MKRCKICGDLKPLSEFYRAAGMADGHRSDCKLCNLAAKKARYDADPKTAIERVRRWQEENSDRLSAYRREYRKRRKAEDRESHLRRKFGITQADYDRMLAEQGGGCAICGKQPGKKSLHVDHDHVTGRVRGLLCVGCNNALGLFRESHELFASAMRYLDRDDELAERVRARARELVGA